MSKKTLGVILNVAAIGLMFVPGLGTVAALGIKIGVGALLSIGLTVAGSILLKPKGPKLPQDALSRLQASFEIHAPRKIVFGHTAMATDLRYQAYTGSNQEYLEQILCVASHECESIDELWFDAKLAWSASGGVTADYAGYLTVAVRNPGTSANGIAIDSVWTSACTLTGCAYLHIKYKLPGNDQKYKGPFASSIPSRVTVRGKGARVPDLRVGGVDPADQSTWVYSDAGSDSGRNPAWQRLFYLIGWRIEGKLAVGRGVPPSRLDLASYTTAANHCDETLSLDGGGTEPRYRADMVFSEGDDPANVLGNINAAMNAVPTDEGGRIGVFCLHYDLSDPDILELTDDDLAAPESEAWNPHAAIQDGVNIVRGRHTDPSDASLYQLAPEQEVTLGPAEEDYGSLDGIQRLAQFDAAAVQSATQHQRLMDLKLQRAQVVGVYKGRFKARGWLARMWRPVVFGHRGLGFEAKLFRVIGMALPTASTVELTFREESPDLYPDEEKAPLPPRTAPDPWDWNNDPGVQAIDDAGRSAEWPSVTDPENTKPDDNATNSADPASPFGPDGTVGDVLGGIVALEEAELDAEAAQRQLERDAGTLGEAVLRAVSEANRSREVFTDAGIHVDPTTGEVRIEAVHELEREINEVSINLDAANAQISLRATNISVDEKIALAVLDPSQIADLEDIQVRLGAAEVDIDGLEASIVLKADATTLTALAGTVTTISTNLDALEGTVTTKADSTTVTTLDARVGSVESEIDAMGDVVGITQVVRQVRYDLNLSGEALLRALLAGDVANRARLAQAAQVQNELTTKIVDDVFAEATARLTLAAAFYSDLGTTNAAVVAEAAARASGDSANALSITTLSTTVGGHSATLVNYGESIDGLLVKAGLLLDVDGRVIGWTLLNDGEVGDMEFMTDIFRVRDPDLGVVFQIVDGVITGAGLDFADVIGGTRPEDDADVTSAIDGLKDIVIDCDVAGAPFDGELPRSEVYRLYKNGTALTSDVAWQWKVIAGGINAIVAADGWQDLDGTGAAEIVIDSAEQIETRVQLKAVEGARTRYLETKVRKALAAATVGGGGGSGGAIATDNLFNAISGTSWTDISDELEVPLEAGETSVNLTFPALAKPARASPDGNWTVEIKWSWWNGASWDDVGTAFSGDTGVNLDVEGFYTSENATIDANTAKTGLTGGTTQKFKLVARLTSGTKAHTFIGTATAQAAA